MAAAINIRGTDLFPSTYSVQVSEIFDKEIVSASGRKYYEVVGIKRQIKFSYNILTQSELATIMQLIRPNESNYSPYFTVIYFDTQTGMNQTGTFSAETRIANSEFKKDEILYFMGVEFTLNEQ